LTDRSYAVAHPGRLLMDSDLRKEFESCREMFTTEEEKQAFDQQIKLLLEQRGLDYVRGYVDALKDILKRTAR
jgi:hypothetical protein